MMRNKARLWLILALIGGVAGVGLVSVNASEAARPKFILRPAKKSSSSDSSEKATATVKGTGHNSKVAKQAALKKAKKLHGSKIKIVPGKNKRWVEKPQIYACPTTEIKFEYKYPSKGSWTGEKRKFNYKFNRVDVQPASGGKKLLICYYGSNSAPYAVTRMVPATHKKCDKRPGHSNHFLCTVASLQ